MGACLFVLRAAAFRVMFGPGSILLLVAAASAVCQQQPRHFNVAVVARADLPGHIRRLKTYAVNAE